MVGTAPCAVRVRGESDGAARRPYQAAALDNPADYPMLSVARAAILRKRIA